MGRTNTQTRTREQADQEREQQAQAQANEPKETEKPRNQPAAKGKSVVPTQYKKRYGKDGNNGDAVARWLMGRDVTEVATQNGVDVIRWAHLNPGMQRMNAGNRLRALWRNGKALQHNGEVLEAPEQKEETK